MPIRDRVPPLTAFITGAGVTLVGKVGGQVIHVMGQVAVARLFGPIAFGLFAIGWTLFRFGSYFAPLGLHTGVIRYGSVESMGGGNVRGIAGRSIGVALAFGTILGAIGFLASPWLANLFGDPQLTPLLRLFALAVPVAAGLRVAAAATRISQRMNFSVVSENLVQPTTFLVFVIAAYLLNQGIQGAVAALLVSYSLAILLALRYVTHLFGRSPDTDTRARPRASTGEIIRFSLPSAFAGIFSLTTIWADRLFLGYFADTVEVGIYQAASQSAILFMTVNTAATMVLAPLIADLYARRELGQLNDLFVVSTKWALYLTLPAFLVILFVPGPLLHVVFGAEYTGGSTALVVLTMGQVVNVSTGAVAYMLIMTGHERPWLAFSVLAFMVNLGLNALLVPRFGSLGAASATSLSLVALYVPSLFYLRAKTELWPFDRRFLVLGGATAASIVALVALTTTVGFQAPLLRLASVGLVATLVSWAVLLRSGVGDEERAALDLIATARSRKRVANRGSQRIEPRSGE